MRINPKLASALLAIGKYYNRIGKAEMALPYFERLSKILPQDNTVKLQLAESFDALGRKEEADRLYGAIRETKSNPCRQLYYFSRNTPSEGNAALIAEIEGLLSRDDLTDSSAACSIPHSASFTRTSAITLFPLRISTRRIN